MVEIHPSFSHEGLKGHGHKISVVLDTRESNLGIQYWLWFYICFIMILLQNAKDINKKWERYFIIKCDIRLLHSASGFLSQNATALL